jgi:hypothetical protein
VWGWERVEDSFCRNGKRKYIVQQEIVFNFWRTLYNEAFLVVLIGDLK